MSDTVKTGKVCRKCGSLFAGRKCLPCQREYMRVWYRNHPEASSQYGRKRRSNNPAACRESVIKSTRKNWAQTLLRTSKYSKTNRGEHSITREDILEQYRRQGGLCYWWGVPMELTNQDPASFRKVSLDRKDASGGYVKDNIVLCTWAANRCKGTMSAAEFMQLQEDISRHYHNAPVHTMWSDPARFLPTPPESEPPPDPLTGDQA